MREEVIFVKNAENLFSFLVWKPKNRETLNPARNPFKR